MYYFLGVGVALTSKLTLFLCHRYDIFSHVFSSLLEDSYDVVFFSQMDTLFERLSKEEPDVLVLDPLVCSPSIITDFMETLTLENPNIFRVFLLSEKQKNVLSNSLVSQVFYEPYHIPSLSSFFIRYRDIYIETYGNKTMATSLVTSS